MSRIRVVVDTALCQGHSVCQEEAPEIFEVVERDEHYPQVRVKLEFPPEELQSKAREAASYCPNRVIRLEMVED